MEQPLSLALDPERFRTVVGHFASGVTVITTSLNGVAFGTTASAVSSLSLEPPMMLVCLNQSSETHTAVQASDEFVINILASDQAELALQFARKGDDKFLGVELNADHELPHLEGALATLTCRVSSAHVGGTHTVFFGEVIDASYRGAEPLAYYRGKFGAFEAGQPTERNTKTHSDS